MPFRQLKVSFTASWLVNQRDKQLTYVTQRNGKNSSDSIFSAPGYCQSSLPSEALLRLKGSTGPVLNLSCDTAPRRNPEPSDFKGQEATGRIKPTVVTLDTLMSSLGSSAGNISRDPYHPSFDLQELWSSNLNAKISMLTLTVASQVC